MSQKFRVVTEGREEHGHRFAKGDIVARIHRGRIYGGGLEDYVCIEGARPYLEQMLRPEDVEAIE